MLIKNQLLRSFDSFSHKIVDVTQKSFDMDSAAITTRLASNKALTLPLLHHFEVVGQFEANEAVSQNFG